MEAQQAVDDTYVSKSTGLGLTIKGEPPLKMLAAGRVLEPHAGRGLRRVNLVPLFGGQLLAEELLQLRSVLGTDVGMVRGDVVHLGGIGVEREEMLVGRRGLKLD